MKTIKLFTLFIALFSMVILQAQEEEEMKLLFNKKDKPEQEKQKIANGGYGSMSVGWTQIDGKNAMVIGARAAWIANHHFALGLAGRGFFNNFDNQQYFDESYDPNYDPNYSLSGGYGGLLLEPILAPMSPVHVSFPILIGAGGVATTPVTWQNIDYYNYYYFNSDAYFVLEPGVDVEFNITKFFRVALGGSYRYTSNVYLQHKYLNSADETVYENVPTNALRGFNVDISLKFGWF
ncbi:MAG: hypothetical protein V2I62_08115 [Bacteroidales bacterium]|jgi:hypothetical protein|nr:hypothetical protein [Bacteroidales bacterium]